MKTINLIWVICQLYNRVIKAWLFNFDTKMIHKYPILYNKLMPINPVYYWKQQDNKAWVKAYNAKLAEVSKLYPGFEEDFANRVETK